MLVHLIALLLAFQTGCQPEAPESRSEAPRDAAPAAYEAPVAEPDSTTRRLFEDAMAYARAERLHERPIGEVMQALGLHFRGKPYAAGLLDEPAEERLICTLSAFDCVTFVETTLAMARAVQAQDYTFETFARNVRDTRYRDGEMGGYCSRMHYFSEWIADNEDRGTVRGITREIGGVPLEKELDFMTAHRESYPRFARNDSIYACIRAMEAGLQDLELYYVPQDRIRTVYDELQAGDIVALATDIEGLDVVHTGLVYDGGGAGKGLLHASTSGGVKVSPDLQRYVENVKRQIGIVIARPVDRTATARRGE